MAKTIIQESILRNLYEKRKMSNNEISKLLDMSVDIIAARRLEYGIKSRSLSEAQSIAWSKGKYANRNVDNIRKACKNMGKTFGKINGGKNKKYFERICPNCNNEFSPSKKNQLCCSKECMKKYYVKEKHWAYLHGNTLQTGIGWNKSRNYIVRFYKEICQNCLNNGSVVHHIYPRRMYYDVNNSNESINLILLCERCHRIIDSKLRWNRKEGEVRESLKLKIAMVTLIQASSEMRRKVQRLMDEAKFDKLSDMLIIPTRAPSPKGMI